MVPNIIWFVEQRAEISDAHSTEEHEQIPTSSDDAAVNNYVKN